MKEFREKSTNRPISFKMGSERGRLFFLVFLCLGLAVVPTTLNFFSLTVQMVPPIISSVYYHYFRQYLRNVPPGSTTVNHYIFYSLSWTAQIIIIYFNLLTLAFSIFQATIQGNLAFCIVLTPHFLWVPLALHFTFMTAIKLFITVKPQRFLEVNHERLWRCLQATIVVLTCADSMTKLYVNHESYCSSPIVTFMANAVGHMNLTKQTVGQEVSIVAERHFPSVLIFFVVACMNYCIASIILLSRQRKKSKINIAPHFELIPFQQHQATTSDVPNFQVGPSQGELINNSGLREQVQESSLQLTTTGNSQTSSTVQEPSSIFIIQVQEQNVQSPVQQDEQSSRSNQSQTIAEPTASSSREVYGVRSLGDQEFLPEDDGRRGNKVQIPSEPQQSQTTTKKLFKVVTLGGFISGVSMTILVTFFFLDKKIHLTLYRVVAKLLLAILVLMPVYWVHSIPEAKNLMSRKIKTLTGIWPTQTHT